MTYYAHSKEGCGEEEWQTIREHSENVAQLCMQFSAAWCTPDMAYDIGILHDIGKYQPDFQRRIRNENIQIEHAFCGALACSKYHAELASYCIAGHHTGLPDCGTRLDGPDDRTLCGKLKRIPQDHSAYLTELSPKTIGSIPLKVGLASDPTLGKKQVAFWIRMMFSALVDADFLDTERFCSGKARRPTALATDDCLAKLVDRTAQFPTDSAVSRARAALLQQSLTHCDEDADLYLMNMPTGSGKTLASMRFALELAKRKGLKRIIYIIPYTSIIEQNAAVFREIFGEEIVLEHHCNFDYDASLDRTTAEKIKHAAENWDIPIVVTTNVQFFCSVYGNKPSRARKLHNIAESVLIFDEVHMFPSAYYLPCLEAVRMFVKDYGCKALFLTATMPSFRTWLSRFGCKDVHTCELICDHSDFSAFERCTIEDAGELALEQIVSMAEEARSALIVVNTRRAARAVYACLPAGERYHLSTYMTKHDRTNTIRRVREALKAGEKFVLVSTSLIEAGVDLDFEATFRERAGLDHILQTAGRCNRNGRLPKENCHTYVFGFSDGSLRTKDKHVVVEQHLCQEVMHEHGVTQAAIVAYFDKLYSYYQEEMAQFDFSKYITPNGFRFESYANAFNYIDSDTIGVIVPDQEEEEAHAIELLAQNGRIAKRKLQKYAVDLKIYEFERLQAQGVLRSRDGLYFLNAPNYYDSELGIALQDDTDYII